MDSRNRNSPFKRNSWRLTPHNSNFMKPQRYSVSEMHGPSSPLNYTATGPLLASTPISCNLSTYMDSRSPGLSERVVQYNNETQECRATHQTKYGMPGVFPVVHLFKKKLPTRTVTPSKVTVQVTMRESPIRSSLENPNISEDITIQHNDSRSHHDTRESSIATHSVLDALKEISRKRIHAGDQCIQSNNYKRHRTECYIDLNEIKNSNEPAAPSNNIGKSVMQSSDVPCIVNEVTASLTSSYGSPIQPNDYVTNITPSKIEERKVHVNVETQTDDLIKNNDNGTNKKQTHNKQSEQTKISSPVNNNKNDDICNDPMDTCSTEKEKVTVESPDHKLTFSDDTVSVKQGKVTALLSFLTGNTSASETEKSNTDETITDASKTKDDSLNFEIKPTTSITSILSHHDKPKEIKHVTFNIPEKQQVTDPSNGSVNSNNIILPPITGTVKENVINDPISPPKPSLELNKISQKIVSPATPVINIENAKKEQGSFLSTPKLLNQISTSNAFQIPFSMPQKTWSQAPNTTQTPTVEQKPVSAIATSIIAPTAITTSPSKPGGFKFEFQSQTAQSKSSVPAISSWISTSASSQPTFSFTNSSTPAGNFLKPPVSSSLGNAATKSNLFAPPTSTIISFTPQHNINQTPAITTTTTTNSNQLRINPKFETAPPQFKTNTLPQFNSSTVSPFNTNTITPTTTTAIPLSSSNFNTSSPFMKSSNTSVAPTFSSNQNQTLNKTTPQESGFKFALTKSPATSMFPSATSSAFGSFTATANTTAHVAVPSNIFSFASNTTKGPTSLTSATPAFSSTLNDKNPSVFSGGAAAAVVQPSVFGASTNNQNNTFGTVANNNAFGTNFKGNVFASPPNPFGGSTNASQPETFAFNTSQTSIPSTTSSGVFSFGSQPSGNTNQQPTFGSSITTPATTTSTNTGFNSSGFGSNTFAPQFNAPPTGMFSIGTGSSAIKPRTQLKARRRT